MPNTAIFIRSYHKDFQWLVHCLNSIQKYCVGFSEVILVVPSTDSALVPDYFYDLTTSIHSTRERTVGYIDQQITKLQAYRYTSAPFILYVDSDCIFHSSCTPDSFFTKDKPDYYYTPYSHFPPEEQAHAWQGITEKAIGFPVANEYMRRIPLMFRRSTLLDINVYYPSLIKHCCNLEVHNGFSEFNFMGAYAHKKEEELYNFLDTTKVAPKPTVAKQYWSWGGITNDIQKEIDNVFVE
jgi:hypothetical protein